MSDPLREHQRYLTRRTFLGDATRGIGAIALGSLLVRDAAGACAARSWLNVVSRCVTWSTAWPKMRGTRRLATAAPRAHRIASTA